jgi:GST-like protein
MIQLYAFDTPNGRKMSVALEEMQIPYTVHVVDIGKDEQFSESFLKISPNNKIPAIIDEDGPGGKPISIFESGAILIYLGEKTGKFYPTDPAAKVQVLQWLMFQMASFGPMPGQVHHFASLIDDADKRYGLARFRKETTRLYGVMDKRLQEAEYFGGDEVTIADFAIIGWAWRHERHMIDLGDYPAVQRWYQAMMKRPGTAKGFEVKLKR